MRMMAGSSTLTQASLQLTVSPVVYAIALRTEDPDQLRDAVRLACWWWGGIRFPWLPVADDGTLIDNPEELCDALDVVGIIDLTRPDAGLPVPQGLTSLGLPVLTSDRLRMRGVPVRGVAGSSEAPLVMAPDQGGGELDPVALLGLGCPGADQRVAWEDRGQVISEVSGAESLLPQLDARTAINVTATQIDDFVSTSAFMISTGLVWVLPDTFTLSEVGPDLTAFWNYRALRLRYREAVTVLTRLSTLREREVECSRFYGHRIRLPTD
jgi:hypothetical protein